MIYVAVVNPPRQTQPSAWQRLGAALADSSKIFMNYMVEQKRMEMEQARETRLEEMAQKQQEFQEKKFAWEQEKYGKEETRRLAEIKRGNVKDAQNWLRAERKAGTIRAAASTREALEPKLKGDETILETTFGEGDNAKTVYFISADPVVESDVVGKQYWQRRKSGKIDKTDIPGEMTDDEMRVFEAENRRKIAEATAKIRTTPQTQAEKTREKLEAELAFARKNPGLAFSDIEKRADASIKQMYGGTEAGKLMTAQLAQEIEKNKGIPGTPQTVAEYLENEKAKIIRREAQGIAGRDPEVQQRFAEIYEERYGKPWEAPAPRTKEEIYLENIEKPEFRKQLGKDDLKIMREYYPEVYKRYVTLEGEPGKMPTMEEVSKNIFEGYRGPLPEGQYNY